MSFQMAYRMAILSVISKSSDTLWTPMEESCLMPNSMVIIVNTVAMGILQASLIRTL